MYEHDDNASSSATDDDLTQYCQHCGYDLYGLPEDRCPECGHTFDRGSIPHEGRPKQRYPLLAPVVFLGAVVLGVVDVRVNASYLNLAVELGRLLLIWGSLLVWVWLTRKAWQQRKHQHRLLWLLVPCLFAAGNHGTPPVFGVVPAAFSGLVVSFLLVYVLWKDLWNSIEVLLSVFALMLIPGLLLVGTGIVRWAGGLEQERILPGLATTAVGLSALLIARWVHRRCASDPEP